MIELQKSIWNSKDMSSNLLIIIFPISHNYSGHKSIQGNFHINFYVGKTWHQSFLRSLKVVIYNIQVFVCNIFHCILAPGYLLEG